MRRWNKRHIFMVRWGAPCVVVCLAIGYLLVVASARDDPAAPSEDGEIEGLTSRHDRQLTTDMVRIQLEDATTAAGINFQHFPDTRRSVLPEDMGSGLAWGDYDGDGDADLFLVNFFGSIFDPIPADADTGRCALYRNDGNGRFSDVSRIAGLDLACFGMAGAWGDYDNDGDLDLYLTRYGPNSLFQNNGDGTFTDVTDAAGVSDDRFSAGSAWGDYDRDGDIDLYVCNYVEFVYRDADAERSTRQYGSETPYTLNPSAYAPVANSLFRNNNDGTFTDIAEEAGVSDPTGRSLVAAWFDFDNDGWVDLYVANDVSSNGVFRNRGDGTFADIGASSLAADYRGAMGLAVGDYDHDADADLFVTHWVAQENAFFENAFYSDLNDDSDERRMFFVDVAYPLGVGHLSLDKVGWATSFADFDNDGYSDLWIVNGHTLQDDDDHTRLRRQQAHLLRQQPTEGFFEMAEAACPSLAIPIVGRGGAHADYDGDGRVDLAILAHGGRVMLLRNISPDPGHWITLRLRQQGSNTHCLGARIVLQSGESVRSAQVGADAPYLSQNDTDVHFGLGDTDRVDRITIHWPDGTEEALEDVPANQCLSVTHTPHYNAP
ncbi:MAG: hypothetical protein CMJ49_05410 [Planctomycetaceae bacterium]|nr:hypothetical protein [Planctomycetaceae bacterium]